MAIDKFVIQDQLWIITRPVGVAIYDFDFRQFFDCKTPYEFPNGMTAVSRIGAFDNYNSLYSEYAEFGIQLVHTPEEHLRCTSLPIWYPRIMDLTPSSLWYSDIPSFEQIEAEFGLPVFVKGSRQTSKHQAAASIIRSREGYDVAVSIFKSDPILHWQEFVCRELLELRPVVGGVEGKVPASFEFRTFWWRGHLVGAGRYWIEAAEYSWTETEKEAALEIAQQAVLALDCSFLVIDLAQTVDGDWVIIECNDGMESGYAGASPFTIWGNIISHEASRL